MSDLLTIALAGALAGLGVAMPLGAIGVLILRESMLNGWRHGAAAAAGVATIDVLYCSLAVSVGVAFAPVIRSWGAVPAVVCGLVLVGLGVRQLWQVWRGAAAQPVEVPSHAVFLRFVGLTAINPATLIYFLALAGVLTAATTSWLAPTMFVLGAGAASLAWQLVLAQVGSRLGAVIPQRISLVLGWVASAVVIALGIGVILSGLLRIH